MQKSNSNLTKLDLYLITSLTYVTQGNNRKVYKCAVNPIVECDFLIYCKTPTELLRFINHSIISHKDDFTNQIIKWINSRSISNFIDLSCIEQLNNFISSVIVPKLVQNQTNLNNLQIINPKPQQTMPLNDLTKYDLTRLNQIILEHGISENIPLSKIRSSKHIQFNIEFAKFGFEYARKSSIPFDEFCYILDNVSISKDLLHQVGEDYFLCSIEPFKGGLASFQIDAGKNNQTSLLVFMLSSHERRKKPMIFHIVHNFTGTLYGYREHLKNAVEKAKNHNIEIVGLVTDNLPVQVQAFSHASPDSFHRFYKEDYLQGIVHFRCTNHLLALAFKDWLKLKHPMTEYENRIQKITQVFKKRKFMKFFKQKIPQICQTRWYSAFHTLQMIFEKRKDIVKLYEKPPSSLFKDLNEVADDFYYLITIGFTQVYPLLFPYLKLTYHLQNDDISCIHAVLIIEHYIKEMKENIEEFEIKDAGYELIRNIKKRLLLNKNIQIYQLASLFTPDGIVRFRLKNKNHYNIPETDDFWHNKEGFASTHVNISYQNVNSYKINELEKYKTILDDFKINGLTTLKKNKKERKTKRKEGMNILLQSMTHQKQLTLNKYVQGARDTFEKYRQQSLNGKSCSTNKCKTSTVEISSSEENSDVEFITKELNSNHNENKEKMSSESKDLSDSTDLSDSSYESDSLYSTDSSDDEFSDKPDIVCKDKNYIYFDKKNKDDIGNESYTETDFYSNQKHALKWVNISNLIIKNAKFLGLNDREANSAISELNKLIITPFSNIKSICPQAICPESNFMNYWSLISDLKLNGYTFQNISKIALRFWPISASETGAERAFSKIRWRFPERRNKLKESTMMDEIYVEDAYEQRVKENPNFSEAMWQLPPHKK